MEENFIDYCLRRMECLEQLENLAQLNADRLREIEETLQRSEKDAYMIISLYRKIAEAQAKDYHRDYKSWAKNYIETKNREKKTQGGK